MQRTYAQHQHTHRMLLEYTSCLHGVLTSLRQDKSCRLARKVSDDGWISLPVKSGEETLLLCLHQVVCAYLFGTSCIWWTRESKEDTCFHYYWPPFTFATTPIFSRDIDVKSLDATQASWQVTCSDQAFLLFPWQRLQCSRRREACITSVIIAVIVKVAFMYATQIFVLNNENVIVLMLEQSLANYGSKLWPGNVSLWISIFPLGLIVACSSVILTPCARACMTCSAEMPNSSRGIHRVGWSL